MHSANFVWTPKINGMLSIAARIAANGMVPHTAVAGLVSSTAQLYTTV